MRRRGNEMDVRDDRRVIAALAQFADDVLEVLRVVDARRGDAQDFAARLDDRNGFVDAGFRLHRVGNQHRLDADRVVAADADVADFHFARDAPLPEEWIDAVVHGCGAGVRGRHARSVRRRAASLASTERQNRWMSKQVTYSMKLISRTANVIEVAVHADARSAVCGARPPTTANTMCPPSSTGKGSKLMIGQIDVQQHGDTKPAPHPAAHDFVPPAARMPTGPLMLVRADARFLGMRPTPRPCRPIETKNIRELIDRRRARAADNSI